MQQQQLIKCLDIYRDALLEDILPFWERHAVDQEHGGFMMAVDRDGTVIDTDKGIWQQGRYTWLLGTLYNTVEPRETWLKLAKHGVDFLRAHAFDTDGRMFFTVTREGKPLRKRRYVFSEAFAAMAFAAYAKAAQDESVAQAAVDTFRIYRDVITTPGLVPPKGVPGTRDMKAIGYPMITMNVARTLCENLKGFDLPDAPDFEGIIQSCIDEIKTDFVKPELEVVMECVGMNGEIFDHFDGRTLTPGHAIEAAWFILHESRLRGNDPALTQLGTQMLDWMWARGWDEEYGGLFYFRDLQGLPVQEYWHDMKFWWPHNETVIATLLAHRLTGEEKYAKMHQQVHDWTFQHFPDPEHGEWFGYLHRDGRLSVPLKGNLWKGPFHIPRMLLYCWQLCEAISK